MAISATNAPSNLSTAFNAQAVALQTRLLQARRQADQDQAKVDELQRDTERAQNTADNSARNYRAVQQQAQLSSSTDIGTGLGVKTNEAKNISASEGVGPKGNSDSALNGNNLSTSQVTLTGTLIKQLQAQAKYGFQLQPEDTNGRFVNSLGQSTGRVLDVKA